MTVTELDRFDVVSESGGGVVTEREAMITAVLAKPDDEDARLILADWLEEHEPKAEGHLLRQSGEWHLQEYPRQHRGMQMAQHLTWVTEGKQACRLCRVDSHSFPGLGWSIQCEHFPGSYPGPAMVGIELAGRPCEAKAARRYRGEWVCADCYHQMTEPPDEE